MNIAIYLRFSSSKQQETSIEAQRRECELYCKRYNYTIVREYVDRERSAYKDTNKRLGFLSMIEDSSKGIFDSVLVYSLDRFSRNEYETAMYEYKLNENKVNLLSVVENIEDNAQGFLTKKMFQAFAQYYSKELSQKVKRGMLQAQIDHNSTGGQCVLGYKVVNKKYIINENEKDIVIEIFDRFNKGEAITDICNDLNDRGLKTSRGNKFNRSSFHRILSNKKYIGIYSYIDKNGEVVEDKNALPRIISDEVFYCVQDKLNGSQRKIRHSKSDFLLSGNIVCSCGHKMYGDNPKNKKGNTYYYYFCKQCGARVNRDEIEKQVFEALDHILTADKINELGEMLYLENKKQCENNSLVQDMQDELDATQNEYKNVLVNFAKLGVNDEISKKVLQEYQDKIENMKIQLAKEKSNHILYPKQDYIDFLHSLLNKDDIDNFDYQRNLINLLVDRIEYVDKKNANIYVQSLKKNTKIGVLQKCEWWCYRTIGRTLHFYI